MISVNFSLSQVWLGWWSHQLYWQPVLLSMPFTFLLSLSPLDSMQGGQNIIIDIWSFLSFPSSSFLTSLLSTLNSYLIAVQSFIPLAPSSSLILIILSLSLSSWLYLDDHSVGGRHRQNILTTAPDLAGQARWEKQTSKISRNKISRST